MEKYCFRHGNISFSLTKYGWRKNYVIDIRRPESKPLKLKGYFSFMFDSFYTLLLSGQTLCESVTSSDILSQSGFRSDAAHLDRYPTCFKVSNVFNGPCLFICCVLGKMFANSLFSILINLLTFSRLRSLYIKCPSSHAGYTYNAWMATFPFLRHLAQRFADEKTNCTEANLPSWP